MAEFGYCSYHDEEVDENTYKWKGCWSCYHFSEGDGFPYVSIPVASGELGVSESTVRKWIKEGRLEGYLFERGRRIFSPPYRKYHITKGSVERLKKEIF